MHTFNLDEGTWRDHLKQVGKLVNRERSGSIYSRLRRAIKTSKRFNR